MSQQSDPNDGPGKPSGFGPGGGGSRKRVPQVEEKERGSKRARADPSDYHRSSGSSRAGGSRRGTQDSSHHAASTSGSSSLHRGTGGRERVPMTGEQKRERKRQINRLSAQRKRERERMQLDTLTDRYSQLNYMNEALRADNTRLHKLLSKLKELLASQRNQLEGPHDQGSPDMVAQRMEIAEKIRQALVACAEEGPPARLSSVDPATGSAAQTPTNPFLQTTSDLQEKVKVMEAIREVLVAALRSVHVPNANPSASGTVVVGQQNQQQIGTAAVSQPATINISEEQVQQIVEAVRALARARGESAGQETRASPSVTAGASASQPSAPAAAAVPNQPPAVLRSNAPTPQVAQQNVPTNPVASVLAAANQQQQTSGDSPANALVQYLLRAANQQQGGSSSFQPHGSGS